MQSQNQLQSQINHSQNQLHTTTSRLFTNQSHAYTYFKKSLSFALRHRPLEPGRVGSSRGTACRGLAAPSPRVSPRHPCLARRAAHVDARRSQVELLLPLAPGCTADPSHIRSPCAPRAQGTTAQRYPYLVARSGPLLGEIETREKEKRRRRPGEGRG